MDEERASPQRTDEELAVVPLQAGGVDNAAACRCPRCGDTFSCGARADGCWCQALPAVDPARLGDDPAAASCLCPYCLRQAVELLQQTA